MILGLIIIFACLTVVGAIGRELARRSRNAAALKRLARTKELWKSFALALEVQLECAKDYRTDIPGEGCMTRSRRRAKIIEHWDNATYAGANYVAALMAEGEYE